MTASVIICWKCALSGDATAQASDGLRLRALRAACRWDRMRGHPHLPLLCSPRAARRRSHWPRAEPLSGELSHSLEPQRKAPGLPVGGSSPKRDEVGASLTATVSPSSSLGGSVAGSPGGGSCACPVPHPVLGAPAAWSPWALGSRLPSVTHWLRLPWDVRPQRPRALALLVRRPVT